MRITCRIYYTCTNEISFKIFEICVLVTLITGQWNERRNSSGHRNYYFRSQGKLNKWKILTSSKPIVVNVKQLFECALLCRTSCGFVAYNKNPAICFHYQKQGVCVQEGKSYSGIMRRYLKVCTHINFLYICDPPAQNRSEFALLITE
jgi:hypothetical protein